MRETGRRRKKTGGKGKEEAGSKCHGNRKKQRKAKRQKREERTRKMSKQLLKKDIKSGREEKGVAEVSNNTAAVEQHNTPVVMMSHLLEIQQLSQADRGPSWPC